MSTAVLSRRGRPERPDVPDRWTAERFPRAPEHVRSLVPADVAPGVFSNIRVLSDPEL